MDIACNLTCEPSPIMWLPQGAVAADAGIATEAGQVIQTELGQDIQKE